MLCGSEGAVVGGDDVATVDVADDVAVVADDVDVVAAVVVGDEDGVVGAVLTMWAGRS